ncbi:MAG: Hsp70 family protein [Deltaproteobacteria bacterium]|jgi:molecular chaperone DnaK|nr:Hsp70 family protein [Deltaproteobacteria bacterium]
MTLAVGIDLGTSNSRIAFMDGDSPRLVPFPGGFASMPSAVAFSGGGEAVAGRRAAANAALNPENTVFSSKRLLGRHFSAGLVAEMGPRPFKISPVPFPHATVKAGGRRRFPSEAAAATLSALRRAAEMHTGEEISMAVVSIPALFDCVQRQAVLDAARMAGLGEPGLLADSAAHVLAFAMLEDTDKGVAKRKEQRVASVSLGGGFLDVTVAEYYDGVFEVKSSGGDAFLGGDDWDGRIVRFVMDEFLESTGLDLSRDPGALARLWEAAERAKIDLSYARETEILLSGISSGAPGRDLRWKVTREAFEAMTADLSDRLVKSCEGALKDSGLSPGELDCVLLSGGMAGMPGVSSRIEGIFGRRPMPGIDPDGAVALGCAMQAGVMTGCVKDLLFLDVVPLSLGVEIQGGAFESLIGKNCTIPTKRSQLFCISEDCQLAVKEFPCVGRRLANLGSYLTKGGASIPANEDASIPSNEDASIPAERNQIFSGAEEKRVAVEIHVLQGESPEASANRSLCRFWLEDVPPAPRGAQEIEVSFDIDRRGKLNVSAEALGTGERSEASVGNSLGISEEDIRRIAGEFEARREAELKSEGDSGGEARASVE